MKKLLTLLGSVSLITTTAQMAVACSPNYDQKDKDGNSILIQFLQSIDGTAKISTNDVLAKLINKDGPKNKEKLTLDLLKMINLSILSNAKDNKDMIKEESIYTNDGLSDILVKKWDELSSAVDRQITTEKDKYKKEHGKKWEKEWNKMLVNKYSVYQDDVKSMDKDFLENKYKADILLSDSNNNASKTLLDVLLKTDQMGVEWITPDQVIRKYNALSKVIRDAGDNDQIIANYLRSDLDQIAQIKNSTVKTGEESKWENTSLTADKSDKELADAAREVIKTSVNDIKYDAPVSLNEFTISGNKTRAGFLSNSQRFFLDKWYSNQAPLAISEVVIPFSEGGSFDKGFTQESFKSKDQKDQTNSNNVLGSVEDEKVWSMWMRSNKVDQREDATVKHYDKLMTLSNSTDFTQDMRTVVYDYVLGKDASSQIAGDEDKKGIKIETADLKIETLIDKITRTKDKNFYAYNDKGQVFYVDSTGLHIVKIDGYKLLKEGQTSKNGKKQEGIVENKINNETSKELNTFKEFNKLDANAKVEALQSDGDMNNVTSNKYYKGMNTTVTNEYLHYLVNVSMLKGLQGSASSFDIMAEVKNWAQVSSASDSSSTYWATCVFDYFFKISKTISNQNEFIEKYITFEKSDNETTQETIDSTKEWFNTQLKTKQDWIGQSSSRAFYNANTKWADEIESKTVASNYPRQVIRNSWYDGKMVEKVEGLWWSPTDAGAGQTTTMTNQFVNDSIIRKNYNLVYGNIGNYYDFYKNGGAR
ncbi:lipoprotein [Spiroplasma endosymbiont of Diplazon laetatorius]|uniref:lipoprotein n=1 Tax=Spiroplasma endosymbiont of Diplazon laetatorius TaxID=3066322 RepID=UPI0030CC9755